MARRLAAPLIRHLLEQFRTQQLSARAAARELGLSVRQLYEVYTDYLAAYGRGQHSSWGPGRSGGNHAQAWSAEVLALLRKRLTSKPPASYSFAASEVRRLCGVRLDRAQVRFWAIQNGLAHTAPPVRAKAAVRRWQRSKIGELWQLDASPHAWFGKGKAAFPILNLLDDCSRVYTASKLYQRELLLAYFDLLPEAFVAYGLPLQLYVDYHTFFFSSVPEALTRLGQALAFYGVSFRYAPTPQAKGKIERAHLYWQNRLPAYFASEQITDLAVANQHLQALRLHRNQDEVHRELAMTPQATWKISQREKRSVLRSVPRCRWWPYVWSQRTPVRVADDGRVPLGSDRIRLEVPPRTPVILCQHPSGHHSVLAAPPSAKTKPIVLFTNRPTPP